MRPTNRTFEYWTPIIGGEGGEAGRGWNGMRWRMRTFPISKDFRVAGTVYVAADRASSRRILLSKRRRLLF